MEDVLRDNPLVLTFFSIVIAVTLFVIFSLIKKYIYNVKENRKRLAKKNRIKF